MNSVFEDTINNKNNGSILFISEDENFVRKYKNSLDEKYSLLFFNDDKFSSLDKELKGFDLIIFDNSKNLLNKFVDTFSSTKNYSFNIPMIILQNEITEELSTFKNANTYMTLNKSIDEKQFLTNIELSFNFLYANKKVQFENGFYFDVNREVLFQGKKIIKLTKIEKKLINLLALNPNTLVTYEDISRVVWKGKEFSIFSLRNVVKHIREKTDETFIKNSSNKGYVITTI
jgi:DNA-binding response OmpR family regulator